MRTRIFAGLALAGLLLLGLPTVATAIPEPATGTRPVTIYVDNYPTQVVEGVPAPTRVFVAGTSPHATGTVTMMVEGAAIGPFELVDGTAEMVLTFPAPGLRPLEVFYSGDAVYAPTNTSPGMLVVRTSHAILTVAPAGGAPVGRANVGQTVNLNVTVTGAGDTPTGLIRFYIDGDQVHNAPLVNGSQNFLTQFDAVGSHQISALYLGTGAYAQFPMPAQTLLVTEVPSIGLVASADSVAQGGFVDLGAQLPAGATGTVTFLQGGQVMGSSPVGADGSAAFRLQLNTPGLLEFTAAYSGDDRYSPATSLPVTVQVSAAPVVPGASGGGVTPVTSARTAPLADTGSAGHPATGILLGLGLATAGLALAGRGHLARRRLTR